MVSAASMIQLAARCAEPEQAAATIETVISAPVLARWMRSTSSAVGFAPPLSMSITWPPIMPGASEPGRSAPTPVPTAMATSRRIATDRCWRCRKLRDGLEGERLQRVARKDGGSFTEGDMARRLAAAKVVVVERGQIVVDERVGVQHLDGCAQLGSAVGQHTRDHARGFHAEDGPQPLCHPQTWSGAWRDGWSAAPWLRRAAGARARRRSSAAPVVRRVLTSAFMWLNLRFYVERRGDRSRGR